MMKRACPYCKQKGSLSENRPDVVRAGKFRRKSDSRFIQIFRCKKCLKYFSIATTHPCVNQKKRQINYKVFKEISSSVSMRRMAKNLKVSRTTIARKIDFLGNTAEMKLHQLNSDRAKAKVVQFDDMETFEHTKCKPLSITLAVEKNSRRILGFEVSQMAAKGRLARLSRKKYGLRPDHRSLGRARLFKKLKEFVEEDAIFESDENPYYPKDLMCFFPKATHITHKGQRGSIVGQGELKKVRFDPLFSLNHTCAMIRDNVKRLSRKTWCTTKLPRRLEANLFIYALFHNTLLLNQPLIWRVVDQF